MYSRTLKLNQSARKIWFDYIFIALNISILLIQWYFMLSWSVISLFNNISNSILFFTFIHLHFLLFFFFFHFSQFCCLNFFLSSVMFLFLFLFNFCSQLYNCFHSYFHLKFSIVCNLFEFSFLLMWYWGYIQLFWCNLHNFI